MFAKSTFLPTTLIIFTLILSDFVFSQSPEGINYQAIFRKPSGAIVSGQSLACEIEIMQGNISGNLAYAERHSVITNQQGIANFVIGQGLTTTGVLSDIDWGNGPYYMKLFVDFDGQGNIFQMQQYGAQQLISVPYALHAKVADSIAGGLTIGPQGLQGILDLREFKANRDLREFKANRDLREFKANRGLKEFKATRGPKEFRETKDYRDLLV